MSARYCPSCSSSNIKPTRDKAQSGKTRWKCGDCPRRTTTPLTRHPSHQNGINLKNIKSKTLVITSAMANTDTDYEALAVLDNYVKMNDAQLLVIPVKYRNKDNINIQKDEPLVWDTRLEPYLLRKNFKINKNLTIFAENSINATRKKPLVSKEAIVKESSGIFAHANMCMEVVATARDKIPKILHTTGSISVPNYSNSDMGNEAKQNHTIGAVVVEVYGNKFYMRQLMIKDNEVYDLDYRYTKSTMEKSNPHNIVYGDTHKSRMTQKEYNAIWGKNGLYNYLQPAVQVFHDILDFYADNHHHANIPLLQFQKTIHGEQNIKQELDDVVKFLNRVGGGVIVSSNHNDHLTQWVNKALKSGIANTVSYENVPIMAELTQLATEYISKHNKQPNILNIYLEKYCKVPLIFPSRNQEYRPVHADLGQHGDKGSNGSRPSPSAFLKSGVPTTKGHAHTPQIVNGWFGLWSGGVSTMNMDYAVGLSGWMYAHIIEHKNGQRQMIVMIEGRFRPPSKMKNKNALQKKGKQK